MIRYENMRRRHIRESETSLDITSAHMSVDDVWGEGYYDASDYDEDISYDCCGYYDSIEEFLGKIKKLYGIHDEKCYIYDAGRGNLEIEIEATLDNEEFEDLTGEVSYNNCMYDMNFHFDAEGDYREIKNSPRFQERYSRYLKRI